MNSKKYEQELAKTEKDVAKLSIRTQQSRQRLEDLRTVLDARNAAARH